jgi:hypothetical protein
METTSSHQRVRTRKCRHSVVRFARTTLLADSLLSLSLTSGSFGPFARVFANFYFRFLVKSENTKNNFRLPENHQIGLTPPPLSNCTLRPLLLHLPCQLNRLHTLPKQTRLPNFAPFFFFLCCKKSKKFIQNSCIADGLYVCSCIFTSGLSLSLSLFHSYLSLHLSSLLFAFCLLCSSFVLFKLGKYTHNSLKSAPCLPFAPPPFSLVALQQPNCGQFAALSSSSHLDD